MKPEQWTKEESILVLALYFSKPAGIKTSETEEVIHLARILGRTPDAVYKRMLRFQQWYPVLPFDTNEDLYSEENPAMWEGYFQAPGKAIDEAADIAIRLCAGTLILNLYFQLIIGTMNEKSPEVIELAKFIRQSPSEVVRILHVYASFDPFVKVAHEEQDVADLSLYHRLWTLYEDDLDKLSYTAKYIASHYPEKKGRGRKSGKRKSA